MKFHVRIAPKLAALLIGSMLPLATSAPAAHASCSSYQIGYQGPLTGPEAAFGLGQLAAVKFALSKFKTANPSVNVSATVYEIDDQGDPAIATTVAPLAAANECLLGVVGPAYSGAAIVSMPFYKAVNLPVITPSASRFSLTDPNHSQFIGEPFHRNINMESQIYLDMLSDIGAQTPRASVAYFYNSSTENIGPETGISGISVTPFDTYELSAAEINELGRTAYDSGIRYFFVGNIETAKVSGLVTYLETLGAPQLIFGPYTDFSSINISNSSWSGAWLYTTITNLGEVNSTLGNSFKTAMGVDPGVGSAESYDSALFLLDGIKSGATTRVALNSHISTRVFQGLMGPLSFDVNGASEKRKTIRFVINSGAFSPGNGSEVGINGDLTSAVKTTPTSNFQFKVTDWDLSSVASTTYFHFPSFNTAVNSESEVKNIYLPNGVSKFEIQSDEDSQGNNMRKTFYQATVVSSAITELKDITNPSAPVLVTKTGDTYVLKLKGYNFVATIAGDADYSGSGAVVFVKTPSGDVGTAKLAVKNGNKLYALLDPTKNYRIDFYPSGNNKNYNQTTWDNISFAGASSLAYSATLNASNIFGKINPYPSSGGYIKVLTKDSSGNFTVVSKVQSVGNDGSYGFYLAPGTKYKVSAVPKSGSFGTNTSAEFTAPATGTETIADISFLGVNVSGVISSASGPVVGANYWAYLMPNWQYVSGGQTGPTGNIDLALPIGTYKIVVDPTNIDYSLQNKQFDCIVTDTTVVTDCGTTLSVKKLAGAVSFDGVSGAGRWVDSYGYSPEGNSWGNGFQVRSDGKYAIEGTPGTYEFILGTLPTDTNQTTMGFTEKKNCVVESVAKICNIDLQSNFNFHITNSSGTLLKNKSTSVFLRSYTSGDSYYFNRVFDAPYLNTYTKLALPNGVFYISADNRSQYSNAITLGVANIYKVTVLSGAVTEVKEVSTGTVIQASSGIYTLNTRAPNFKVKSFDGSSPLNNSILAIRDIKNGKVDYPGIVGTNQNEFALPDGSYEFELKPSTELSSGKANGRYFVVVKDGAPLSVTKTGSTEKLVPVDGYYNFSLGVPNMTGTVTKGGSPLSVGIYMQKWNEAGGYWDYDSYFDVGTDGKFSFNLAAGKYRPILNLYSTATTGYASFPGEVCNVPETGTVTCDVVIPSKSLEFTIKNSIGQIQKDVWVNLFLRDVSNVNRYGIYGNSNSDTGRVSIPLFDGTYDLTVSQSTTSGKKSKNFTVTVLNQEVTSVVDVATSTSMVATAGIYDLAFFSPNIKGVFKNSEGIDLVFTQNQSIGAELQKYENGNWNTASWNSFSSTTWEATISSAGKYRFKLNPYDFPDLSTSYSEIFYIDSDRKASRSELTGFETQVTGFNISINSNNLKYKVLNPIDDLVLTSGWIWIYKQETNGQESFYADSYIYPGSGGLGGKYLPEGSYRLILQPNNIAALDRNEFQITVNSSGVVTVKEAGVDVTKVDSRYILKPAAANIVGRTTNAAGTAVGQTNNSGVGISVQKKNESGNWEWAKGGTSSNADGYFGFRIKDIGVYRLIFNPWRKDDVAQTYSPEFEITTANQSTFTKDFGSIALNAPNFKVSVITTDSGAAITNTYVSIQKTGLDGKINPWNVGFDTGDNGIASAYIPDAGTYQIYVQPPWNGTLGEFVAKTYSATAVKDGNGIVSVSVDAGQGALIVDGVNRLKLGSSNLRGTVTSTDGSTVIPDSYVVPIMIKDGQEVERWDLGRNTDQSGKWSISLPEGTFKIRARAPGGSITYGSSATLGNIVVDSDLNVTSVPVGKTALAFTIALRPPTWSGVLKVPTTEDVVTGAGICLTFRVSSNSYSSDCSYVNQLGQWALTLPDGVVLDSESQLYAYDYQNKYPQIRLLGKDAIEAVIGVSGTGKTLRFPSANINVTVTFDGNPIPDLGFSASRPTEWLGNAQTSNLGVAGIYSANNVDAFTANVWVGYSRSALDMQYVSTNKYFSPTEILNGTSGGVFTGTMVLNAPNIRGVVRLPSSPSSLGAVSDNSYLNVYDVEKGEWVSWAATALDGTFAIYLKPGCCSTKEYTLVLEPGINKVTFKQDYVRKEYKVMVAANGVTTITDKQSGAEVSSETLSGRTVSQLTLGVPNINGTVVDPSGNTVPNVNVTASGNCGIYGCYTWSDSLGGFKMNLPDQEAVLQAGNWSTNSGFVKSEECLITVAGGVLITPAGGCVQANGTIKLALRAPNFTFTLKNAGVAVNNAWINVRIGNWWTYAPADQSGSVALFIDDAAVLAANGGVTGQTLKPHIYVDPYGSSGAVRWDCEAGSSKPICSQLTDYVTGQSWGTKNLGDIQVQTSNIKIKSIRPDNNAAVRYSGYIELLRTDRGYDEWTGWSQTDSEGFGNFYLDEANYSGAKFKVRLVPSWELRSSFASKTWDNNGAGYNFADLNNLSLSLATPNLKLTVVSPSGANSNKWGWVSIETIDTSTASVSWYDGNSLDDSGSVSFTLKPSSSYKLTAYPGSGRSGTATQCFLQTDTATAVTITVGQCVGGTFTSATALTLALARGNIIGTIFGDDGVTPLAGATIYANIVGATDESKAVVSCTLSNGTYGVTLDPNYVWELRVLPANAPSDLIKYRVMIYPSDISPPGSGSTTINMSLVRQ